MVILILIIEWWYLITPSHFRFRSAQVGKDVPRFHSVYFTVVLLRKDMRRKKQLLKQQKLEICFSQILKTSDKERYLFKAFQLLWVEFSYGLLQCNRYVVNVNIKSSWFLYFFDYCRLICHKLFSRYKTNFFVLSDIQREPQGILFSIWTCHRTLYCPW